MTPNQVRALLEKFNADNTEEVHIIIDAISDKHGYASGPCHIICNLEDIHWLVCTGSPSLVVIENVKYNPFNKWNIKLTTLYVEPEQIIAIAV